IISTVMADTLILSLACAICAQVQGETPAPARPVASTLELVATIAMPKVEGRIDHMAFDTAHGVLYVAALVNGSVESIDLASGAVKRLPAGVPEASGVVCVGAAGEGG